MGLEVGDVYWFEVFYPSTNETERRPVLIYEIEGNNVILASFAAISSSEIEDFDGKYDKWKSPIFMWKEAGLSKESFVKSNCLAQVEESAFLDKDFMGSLTRSDFRNAKRKINEFLDSGDDSW
ncbi:type II toxin-antitoxin system PemK/MazF family toxin [Psychrobacillus psychrodurans]|uniref:type II toxin-antitoxin system PemK/MazF family toxin n=1 Tax=Psychrobacillus psychrodurans TaxID=126157 RepID=UPI001F4DEB0F|nr:type II toxin-antitoxin system PemK/MazF family toxin [Psychrobacillus psychrodurans]MCK1997974.1 type II toxin-antitoxin system PemK/MazF family toxin [Psychrobacillus psychrodurans]